MLPKAALSRIDFQVGIDGWILDDLLLEMENGQRCSMSIKNNVQFGATKAPKSFVSGAWRELLGLGGSPFNPETDLLSIASVRPGGAVAHQLDHLRRMAAAQDATALETRMDDVAQGVRTLYNSFSCPSELGDHGDFGVAARLLRRLVLFWPDFDAVGSIWRSHAVRACQRSLVSGSHEQAELLWRELIHICEEAKRGGGFITRQSLLERLGGTSRLAALPHFAAYWNACPRTAELGELRSRSCLADGTRIERTSLLQEMIDVGSRFVVLTGPSGAGKSALAAEYAAQRYGAMSAVVWLRAGGIRDAVEDRIHDLTLDRVIDAAGEEGLLIIDGLDRSYDDDEFRAVERLLRTVAGSAGASGWTVVLTSQTPEWPRVLDRLRGAEVPWKGINVPLLSDDELTVVARSSAKLRPLLQGHARSALRNLKVLDLASRVDDGGSVVTDIALAEGFLKRLVRDHPQATLREATIKTLATMQADRMSGTVPVGHLPHPEALDELARDGVCTPVEHGRAGFTHDLFGDWVRRQILVEQRGRLSQFLASRMDLQLWRPAVRLYAQELVRTSGAVRWREALDELRQDGDTVMSDMFLEALFSGHDASECLTAVTASLVENDGTLLQRMLVRFWHVATVPSSQVALLFGTDTDLSLYAETAYRIPVPSLWGSMLSYLAELDVATVKLAAAQLARTGDLWLRSTEAGYPLRAEAAKIAVGVADWACERELGRTHISDDDALPCRAYRAAMAAVSEQPERVSRLLRHLAARDRPPGPVVVEDRFEGTYTLPDPWPHGPAEQVDGALERISLETDALVPVMAHAPELAREILLAVLIEEPRHYHHGEARMMESDLAVTDAHRWHPPLPVRGPFLPFLQISPTTALSTVIDLVNFVSERWLEHVTRRDVFAEETAPGDALGFDFDGRRWIGDYRHFCWYRGLGSAPSTVVSALMAVELWLYRELDSDEDVSSELACLLELARSAAWAGVLCAVACHSPRLLHGDLLKLAATPTVLAYDRARVQQSSGFASSIGFLFGGSGMEKIAREWHEQDHRRWHVEELLLTGVLNDRSFDEKFEPVRDDWKAQKEAEQDEDSKKRLASLLSRFDRSNYSPQRQPNGQTLWVYNDPNQDEADVRQAAKIQAELAAISLPAECRRLINGEGDVQEADLARFRDAIDQYSRESVPPDAAGFVTAKDIVSGCTAVLLLRGASYLSEDEPEVCANRLLVMVEENLERIGQTDGYSDWAWEQFAADALVVCLASRPNDPRMLKAVAHLAASSAMSTVQRVHWASSRALPLPLQASIQTWAIEVARAKQFARFSQDATRMVSYEDPAATATGRAFQKLQKRRAIAKINRDLRHSMVDLDATLESLASGSLAPNLVEWAIQPMLRPVILREEHRRVRLVRAIPSHNFEHLQWAFAPYGSTVDDVDEEVKREIGFPFFKAAMRALRQQLVGEHNAPNFELDQTPYPSDRWVIENVAAMVGHLPVDEAEFIWKPFLSLGSRAHYWVEDFLREWFIRNLHRIELPPHFVENWRAMIAVVIDVFHRDHGHRSYYSRGHVNEVMGLGAFGARAFDDERHATLLLAMTEEYRTWAEAFLEEERSAKEFALFLQKKAAVPLRSEALVWLDAASRARGGMWRGDNAPEALCDLLYTTWTHDVSIAAGDSPTAKAFRGVLRQLVDLQLPKALTLSDRVGSRTRDA